MHSSKWSKNYTGVLSIQADPDYGEFNIKGHLEDDHKNFGGDITGTYKNNKLSINRVVYPNKLIQIYELTYYNQNSISGKFYNDNARNGGNNPDFGTISIRR